MQAALRRIQIKYPHIFVARCARHGLNLLVKDFIKLQPFAATKPNSVEVVKMRLKRGTNAIFKRADWQKGTRFKIAKPNQILFKKQL